MTVGDGPNTDGYTAENYIGRTILEFNGREPIYYFRSVPETLNFYYSYYPNYIICQVDRTPSGALVVPNNTQAYRSDVSWGSKPIHNYSSSVLTLFLLDASLRLQTSFHSLTTVQGYT